MRRTGCGMTLAMLGCAAVVFFAGGRVPDSLTLACAAVVAGALVWWATAVLEQPKP